MAHERGITPDVRLVIPEPESLEAHEPWRMGWTEEEKTDFNIPTEAVGEVEGRVRSVQQDVHAARTAR